MANDPQTDFGDGGVGSQKQDFVGNDQGILSDERRLPDENPNLTDDNGSLREHDSGETQEGEPDAGMGTDTQLADGLRHSGRASQEASY